MTNTRLRARKAGVPFTLAAADIAVPTHCPVLGIPLAFVAGKRRGGDGSPALEMIDPSRGFTSGNVVVISAKARRLSADATTDELEAVAAYYRGLRGH